MNPMPGIAEFAALPAPVAATLGAVLGLVAGSYLATLLLRWPVGQSANQGRSRCDTCARQLAWFEVIPLLGYLAARGRCRSCTGIIARSQPLIELLCGLTGAWFFAIGIAWWAPLCWLLIALAAFDARHLWLPDPLVAVLAAIALIVPGWDAQFGLPLRLAAGVGGFAALWLVAQGFRRITGREGLGGGDPKLFGAIGLWLGPLALPQLLLAACTIGLLDAALRRLRHTDFTAVQLPLGTYLCAAAIGFSSLGPFMSVQ